MLPSERAKELSWAFFEAQDSEIQAKIVASGVLGLLMGTMEKEPVVYELLEFVFRDDLKSCIEKNCKTCGHVLKYRSIHAGEDGGIMQCQLSKKWRMPHHTCEKWKAVVKKE